MTFYRTGKQFYMLIIDLLVNLSIKQITFILVLEPLNFKETITNLSF